MESKLPGKIYGRDAELQRLNEAINSAAQTRSGVILISGESGVGKTALAETALAQSKYRVYTARLRELSTPPYSPLVSILRDHLRCGGKLDIGRLNDYLALLMPELGAPPQQPDRETLIAAIGAALEQVAESSPTAFFLDDLQWADNATLELLPSLVERSGDTLLAVIGTYRSDEIDRGHALRRCRNELRRIKRLEELAVEGLDEEAVGKLIEAMIGDNVSDSLKRKLQQQSQGIPLYIEELTRGLMDSNALTPGENGLELQAGWEMPVPESIRDAILLRVDTLSEAARSKLDLAAIAGMEFPLGMLVQLSQSPDGVSELFDRGLIVEESRERGSFKHALIREAVRSEINWSKRRELHFQIGKYLEDRDYLPEVIAQHYLAAQENDRARSALLRSAEKSCDLYAYRDAVRSAQQALEIWPNNESEEERIATVEKLAHCAQVSGMLSGAVKAWREVIESKVVASEPRRLAEAYRSLATIYALQHAWQQSSESRKSAAQALLEADRPAEAASELLAAAGRLTGTVQLTSALETVKEAHELAVRADNLEYQARAMALEGEIRAMLGEAELGIERAREGLSLALRDNLTEAAAEIYRRLASALAYSSEYGAAREAYSTALNFCQSQGEDINANVCMGCMSYILYQTGDWKRAIEAARSILKDDRTPVASTATAEGVIGIIALCRGEFKQARKHIERSLAVAKSHNILSMQLLSLAALAGVAEAEENYDEARRIYLEISGEWQKSRERHDVIPVFCSAATFFAAQEDEKELTFCAEALGEIAAATGNPEALAGLAYAMGESALFRDDAASALSQFQQSLEHLDKLDLPLFNSTTRLRAGLAAIAAGEKTLAVDLLRQSYSTARKIGARPLGDQVAAELKKLGVTVEEPRAAEASERSGRGGLTRRQLEIARLLGEGLSNREIGEKLFLSRRTVDMHVGNILNRLNVRSRAEAVKRAAELGLLPDSSGN